MIREILKIRTDTGRGNDDPTFKGIEISEYSYKGSRMGMPELTATLMWAECLDDEWSRKEYVVFNGERFYIRHTPSSSKSNTDSRYKHEITFTSEFAEILGNTYFVDAVYAYASTYDKPCSNNTTFTFYGTIAEFVDRLNCAFLYAGIGDSVLYTKTSLTTDDTVAGDGYCAMLDPFGDYDSQGTYEFSFEDKKLWEVITEGYNITKIPFERRGRRIIFGAVPNIVAHKFEYGYDNELLSVNKNNANAQVINRITMLGSSENIPHYYPNETEYGHIAIAAKDGNKALTDSMVSIVNMTQLLSRLNAGSFAVLGKYDGEDVGDAVIEIYNHSSSFDAGMFTMYLLNSYLTHETTGSHDTYSLWHVRVFFKVTSPGVVECQAIRGNTWIKTATRPESDENMIDDVTLERLATVEDKSQGIVSVDYTSQLEKREDVISLGRLPKGDYFFQFSIKIQNRGGGRNEPVTSVCYLSGVDLVPAAKQKKGYYWAVGDTQYDNVGALGVRISATITDAMIGDGFGWTASDRMPFQDHLIPPRFRSTLGAGRFYNAVNGAYTDPDTGKTYVFPNPYISGMPSEYIFRDDDRKPTIEGVRNNVIDPETGLGQLFGEIADIAYDDNDNDTLKPDTESSDKNDALKYEHSFFYIKLNIFSGDYGFDLFALATQTDAMTIQMRSGPCNGCKFKIQAIEYTDADGLVSYKNPVQTTGADGNIVAGGYSDKVKEEWQEWQQDTQTHSIWICVQKDADTFGVIMPNQSNNYNPSVGDTFNIINIDLPQEYIIAAEKRLEEDGIRFMADNNEEKFTFDIQASRIFFAEHPEVLSQLDEYSKIRVHYNGRVYEQYVNQFSIDCKNNEPLPNIGISLTDTLAVGQSFVDNVAERAASLISNAITLGGNLGSGTGGLSAALTERRYLNKQKSDRTPYDLSVGGQFTAEGGAHFGDFVQGIFAGRGGAVDSAGNAEVESITVRGYMKVMELIYNRLNALEGDTSFADSGTVDSIFNNADGTMTAQLRRRWEGDFTAFQPGDIVYGYVNNLNRADAKEYYKAWAWIKSVNRADNQLTLVSYPDSEVPAGINHSLAEDMVITRWGNNIEPNEHTFINPDYSAVISKRGDSYYNKRQRLFYISSDDGNLVELMGVNKPILEKANYGTILGIIPDGLLDSKTEELINKGQPYLFARGIIVQDLIRIGYEGLTTRLANYRGTWNAQTAASETDYYRSTVGMYDTVTWDGALWQCVISNNTEEPSAVNPAWVKMTATNEEERELRMWVINPNTNIVSVRKDEVIPPILSANVTLNSSNNSPTVFSSNLDLYDAGAELFFSTDGLVWKNFIIGIEEPLELEDETGVIELEDSVDDSQILTVGGNDISTDTIGDRIYFELRSVEDGTILASTQVPVVKDGKDGTEGRDGLMVYPAGYYDPEVYYTATEDTTPVVMYGEEGDYNYFRLKAGATYKGTAASADRNTPAKDVAKNDSQTVWILFDKFNSIFANIIMADFAKLASAVFVGNWLISQQGLKNGATSSDYQDFQDFKNGTFEPNFAVNFMTGEVRAVNGLFKGRIEADSGTFNNISISHDSTFAGMLVKQPIIINPSNFDSMCTPVEGLDIALLNLEKVGTLIEFRDFTTAPPPAYLPSDRRYVGNTVLIYNCNQANTAIGVSGACRESETGPSVTLTLQKGYMVSLTCKVRIDDDLGEEIYWEYRRGKATQASVS